MVKLLLPRLNEKFKSYLLTTITDKLRDLLDYILNIVNTIKVITVALCYLLNN